MSGPVVTQKFNAYELALLADAALRVMAGAVSVKTASRALSARYRAAALRQVSAISDSYRSEAGVSTNLRAMLLQLQGEASGWASRGELFAQVAEMALNDKEAFADLLRQAEEYYPAVPLPEDTVREQHMPTEQRGQYDQRIYGDQPAKNTQTAQHPQSNQQAKNNQKGNSAMDGRKSKRGRPRRKDRESLTAKEAAIPSGELEIPLFSADEPAEVIVLDGHRVREVLATCLPEGYKKGSFMSWRSFVDNYGSPDEGSSNDRGVWETAIAQHAVVVSEGDAVRYYAPKSLMPDALQRKVYNHICELLSYGQPAVYYAKLLDRYAEPFDATAIHSQRSRLEAYLRTMYAREWTFHDDYLTNDERVEVDIATEVVRVVRAAGRPMKVDEVEKSLSWIPKESVKDAFKHSAELLVCGQNKRCHVSLVPLTEADRETLCQLIETAIGREGYCSRSGLLQELRVYAPSVMEHSAVVGARGVDSAIASLLSEEYTFTRDIITARDDKKVNVKDILVQYAREHKTFMWDEINAEGKTVQENLYLNRYLDRIYKYAIRVDDDTFVNWSELHIDMAEVDAAIDALFGKRIVLPLRAIDNFVCFPTLPYPWTPRLVESILIAREDSRYRYMKQNAYHHEGYYGAVVLRRASEGWKYNDVLAHVLAKSSLPLDISAGATIVEYLRRQGYLATAQCEGLSEIIYAAQQQRQ